MRGTAPAGAAGTTGPDEQGGLGGGRQLDAASEGDRTRAFLCGAERQGWCRGPRESRADGGGAGGDEAYGAG